MDDFLKYSLDFNGAKTEYVIAETSAPTAYDGFGTITVEMGTPRLVLIQKQHFLWQSQRYASGMKSCNPCDVPGIEEIVTQKLRERLGESDG